MNQDQFSPSTYAASVSKAQKAIDEAVSGMYKPSDSLEFANLPTPSASNLGFVYIVTDAFTSDNRFTDYDSQTQTGHDYPANSEVMVIIRGTNENPVYMYNVIGGIMDGYEIKSQQLTYAEYQAAVAGGTVDPNKSYYVPDAPASEFDDTLSNSSENAVQNKVVTSAIGENKISTSAVGTSFTLTDAADGHVQNLSIKGRTDSTTAKSVGENGLTVGTNGKNLFTTVNAKTNGYLNSNGDLTFNTSWSYTDYIPIDAQYITLSVSSDALGNSPSMCFYDSSKNFISGESYKNQSQITFTVPSAATYIRASYYNTWLPTLQIENGSTATAYESPNYATLTTAAPYCSLSEALTDEVDMLAGVVHKKCWSVTFDGSNDENWAIYSAASTSATGSKVFRAAINYPGIAGSTTSSISNYLEPRSELAIYSGNTENIYCFYPSDFGVRISAIGTETDLRTYLASNPVTVVYELNEPYDAPLTSAEISALQSLETYFGTTNITATDSPTMTVDYLRNTENGQAAADMQTNICNRMNALNEAYIAPEYDSTATYSEGDYATYAGTLYKCTSTISTAEQFNAEHWSVTSVTAELAAARSDIDYIAMMSNIDLEG